MPPEDVRSSLDLSVVCAAPRVRAALRAMRRAWRPARAVRAAIALAIVAGVVAPSRSAEAGLFRWLGGKAGRGGPPVPLAPIPALPAAAPAWRWGAALGDKPFVRAQEQALLRALHTSSESVKAATGGSLFVPGRPRMLHELPTVDLERAAAAIDGVFLLLTARRRLDAAAVLIGRGELRAAQATLTSLHGGYGLRVVGARSELEYLRPHHVVDLAEGDFLRLVVHRGARTDLGGARTAGFDNLRRSVEGVLPAETKVPLLDGLLVPGGPFGARGDVMARNVLATHWEELAHAFYGYGEAGVIRHLFDAGVFKTEAHLWSYALRYQTREHELRAAGVFRPQRYAELPEGLPDWGAHPRQPGW